MNIVNEILFEGVSVTFATVRVIIVKVIISLVTVINLVSEPLELTQWQTCRVDTMADM